MYLLHIRPGMILSVLFGKLKLNWRTEQQVTLQYHMNREGTRKGFQSYMLH